mgnify:CR=1 FL=1
MDHDLKNFENLLLTGVHGDFTQLDQVDSGFLMVVETRWKKHAWYYSCIPNKFKTDRRITLYTPKLSAPASVKFKITPPPVPVDSSITFEEAPYQRPLIYKQNCTQLDNRHQVIATLKTSHTASAQQREIGAPFVISVRISYGKGNDIATKGFSWSASPVKNKNFESKSYNIEQNVREAKMIHFALPDLSITELYQHPPNVLPLPQSKQQHKPIHFVSVQPNTQNSNHFIPAPSITFSQERPSDAFLQSPKRPAFHFEPDQRLSDSDQRFLEELELEVCQHGNVDQFPEDAPENIANESTLPTNEAQSTWNDADIDALFN